MRHLAAALLLPALACPGCEEAGVEERSWDTLDLSIALSEAIPTLATLTFDPGDEAIDDAVVEFGPTTGYGTVAAADLSAGPPHDVLLIGSKPSSEVHLRIVASSAAGTLASEDIVFSTGVAPASLPQIDVELLDPDLSAGGLLLTSYYSEPRAAVLVDEDGDHVWWHVLGDEEASISRARPTADGTGIRYLRHTLAGPGQAVTRVSLDGSAISSIHRTDMHHDFVELPDGTVAVLATDTRQVEGEAVSGDLVREHYPDGSSADVYSVWQDADYDPEADDLPGAGWSHANAIDHDTETNSYAVSFFGLDSIFRIDRASGELVTAFGGVLSDFATPAGSTDLIDRQHQFQWSEDRIVVFDNGSVERNSSMAVEYTLDGETADLVWSHEPDPALYCYSLGDAVRLDSGNTLVVFSVNGQIDEVTPDGEVVRRLKLPLGGAFGYITHIDDPYDVFSSLPDADR